MGVYINSIETGVPPFESHDIFLSALPHLVEDAQMREILLDISKKLQIDRRFTCLPKIYDGTGKDEEAFYRPHQYPSTAQRMAAYQEHAAPLASLALEPLLAQYDPKEFTHLILTSCTGFYAPGLDIDIIQNHGLSPSIERNILGFMGCYAGVTGLKMAKHLVQSDPSAKVLMVNLELCSLHWRDTQAPDQIVSFMLFGDGCAASCISSQESGIRLESFWNLIRENTQQQMQWNIEDDGFFMVLDVQIPEELGSALKSRPSELFCTYPLEKIRHWAIHPGGRAILDKTEAVLGLDRGAMTHSRTILREYGNMSSPTILFVLKEIMKEENHSGPGLGMAFGPGLTLETFQFYKI